MKTAKKATEQLIQTANDCGWSMTPDSEGDYKMESTSPEGQDVVFYLDGKDPVKALADLIGDWDPSEEAPKWLDGSGHGKNGAPERMMDVYNDMVEVEKMMQELLDEWRKDPEEKREGSGRRLPEGHPQQRTTAKTNTVQNAGNLDARQLELLDALLKAASDLNEAGVSLLWDEDDNCLCAANRDVMKDCSFFRDEFDQERPEGTVLLSDTASNGLDIEITPVSRDYDLYYFPKEDCL